MNKQNKIMLGMILMSILLIGIGYAALTNIDLTINGKASAAASQDNFKVYFTGANTVTQPTDDTVTATATNGAITATVNIEGLTKSGDSAYAILEIENGSNGIDATSVNVTTQDTDTEYFDIVAQMCDSTGAPISDYAVASGNKTYVKVSAELLKTPTEDVETTIAVTVTAIPAEQ